MFNNHIFELDPTTSRRIHPTHVRSHFLRDVVIFERCLGPGFTTVSSTAKYEGVVFLSVSLNVRHVTHNYAYIYIYQCNVM